MPSKAPDQTKARETVQFRLDFSVIQRSQVLKYETTQMLIKARIDEPVVSSDMFLRDQL